MNEPIHLLPFLPTLVFVTTFPRCCCSLRYGLLPLLVIYAFGDYPLFDLPILVLRYLDVVASTLTTISFRRWITYRFTSYVHRLRLHTLRRSCHLPFVVTTLFTVVFFALPLTVPFGCCHVLHRVRAPRAIRIHTFSIPTGYLIFVVAIYDLLPFTVKILPTYTLRTVRVTLDCLFC